MNLKEMTVEQLEERRAAIANEIENPDADLDALEKEAREIKDELEARKQAEAKKAEIRSAVAAGQGTVVKEFKVEERKMTIAEIRSSEEYINAFANYAKTGDDSECRALLSDNATNGVVPVPTFVGEIVAERVKESKILSRIRHMSADGNVKIGFEIDAPEANIHNEGGVEAGEEGLELGIVTLVPKTFKKWVSISDEALDSMSGRQYLEYLYDEIARGVIKAREIAVLTAIRQSPATATATQPAVLQFPVDMSDPSNISVSDFINMRAQLGDGATDPVVILSPQFYAGYKNLQMSANYNVDVFDGMEVIVTSSSLFPIVGDLSGVMENLPKGDAIDIKYDDKTLMTSDLVRILGRQPSAIGVVGNKYLCQMVNQSN